MELLYTIIGISFKIIPLKMATNYSDEGWGKRPDSSRIAFTWFCSWIFTGGQFLALGQWRVYKPLACTRAQRFLTWIRTWSSVCRLMMLSRKSALERTTWSKKRFVWTEVSMNGQEEVEAGAVPRTYLRYGNTVPMHFGISTSCHLPLKNPLYTSGRGSTEWALGILNFHLRDVGIWASPLHFFELLCNMATLASVAWGTICKHNGLNCFFFQ